MIWLYRILFLPALLLALPYYGYRMWRRGGYATGFIYRFGFVGGLPAKRPGVRRIWIQAVSVGEILAIGPLLKQLAATGRHEVYLTTTTSTGFRLALEKYAGLSLKIAQFPLDFWPCSQGAWDRIQPDLALLMEGELWPEHLHQAGRRGVPVLLVNARLSDRSFRRHRRLRWLLRPLLRPLRQILAGSEQDAARFRELAWGAAVTTTGNLKFDVDLSPHLDPAAIAAGRAELGFAPEPGRAAPLVLLGSSTWPGEEAALLAVLEAAQAEGIDLRLLLVPRHAERRGELERLLGAQAQPWHQRSRERQAPAGTRIYLADTTGELRRLTQLADLAFIGKSLPPEHHEGQTPIEAAGYGLPLLFGPEMSNFREITRALRQRGIAEAVQDASDLRQRALALLRAPELRHQRAAEARAWFAASRGATERTVQALEGEQGAGSS